MHPLSGGVALMARIDASWRAQANGNEGRKALREWTTQLVTIAGSKPAATSACRNGERADWNPSTRGLLSAGQGCQEPVDRWPVGHRVSQGAVGAPAHPVAGRGVYGAGSRLPVRAGVVDGGCRGHRNEVPSGARASDTRRAVWLRRSLVRWRRAATSRPTRRAHAGLLCGEAPRSRSAPTSCRALGAGPGRRLHGRRGSVRSPLDGLVATGGGAVRAHRAI